MSPLKGAILLPNYEPDQSIFSWSRRWSSCAWSRMYLRTISSSKPTVDTKYPRAQKLSPVKLRLRPRKFRATEIALLPLMNPTTFDTANFGGYCQVDVERANLSRRADFLCSHRTAQVTSCQTMKARSRSSR